MKPVPGKRAIADFVRPSLPEARVDRMWNVVASTLNAPPVSVRFRGSRVRMYAAFAAAAVIVLVASLMVALRPPRGGAIAGLVVETHESGQPIALPDGSTLALAPWTRVAVLTASADDVRLRLERGTVTCDVIPGRPRRFVVEAAGAEAEVKGTRFDVEVTEGAPGEKQAVAVRVEHGVVEVRDETHTPVANLQPGQTWMRRAPAPILREPSPEEIPTLVDASVSPIPSTTASIKHAVTLPSPSARELFEQADSAQLGGQPAEAAASFDQLRRRFPNDPRAGVAAFQLGRLRLRKLGDPRGAAEAFSFAIAHSDAGTFREDAAAGLVEALGRAGDVAGCHRARSEFLSRYPSSPLTTSVSAQCPE